MTDDDVVQVGREYCDESIIVYDVDEMHAGAVSMLCHVFRNHYALIPQSFLDDLFVDMTQSDDA